MRIRSTLPGLGLVAAAALTAAGCGAQDNVPYGNLQRRPPDSGPPAYHLDAAFPDIMEFEQGVEHAYDLAAAAHVPPGGTPVLKVEGLPDGATFDGRLLTWTPPCGADPAFYQRDFGLRYVVVDLRSSADGRQYVQRRAALLVHQFKEYPDRVCGQPW